MAGVVMACPFVFILFTEFLVEDVEIAILLELTLEVADTWIAGGEEVPCAGFVAMVHGNGVYAFTGW